MRSPAPAASSRSSHPGAHPTLHQREDHQFGVAALPDEVFHLEGGLDLSAIDQTLSGETPFKQMRAKLLGVGREHTAVVATELCFRTTLNESGRQAVRKSLDVSAPRALSTEEVRGVIADFAQAAANAVEAGFDGIELHGANGYLIEQFLNPLVNDRTDAYRGDTLEGRTRFLLEAVDAVIARIGADKTAIRLSPYGGLFDMGTYPEIEETYLYLAGELSRRGLAYIHLMDQKSRGSAAIPEAFLARFRARFHGVLILAGGMTRERAEQHLANGLIDIAAFGEPFIANPDLVERLRNDWPLAQADRTLHYGGGAEGYTDHPSYNEERNAA